MRMWLCNPRILCRKHLLGEHVEMAMFVGSINKKIKMDGYIKNNLLEPLLLKERHDDLVAELLRRGYNHNSPLPEYDLTYLPTEYLNHKIDRFSSLKDLLKRCPECRKNFVKIMKGKK